MAKVEYNPSLSNPYFEDKLVQYRKQRPAKTSGNPYYVLGEPIGDLRDNMGCHNIDLSHDIHVEEHEINGIKFRTYSKENLTKRPCVFFIHGGAFIGGSIDTVENPCKYLCQESGALVINIDYRLAPEFPFPTQIEDCLNVINEVYSREEFCFDRKQMFISGDSAGGNLALACLQQDYKLHQSQRFLGSILYYPVVDLTCQQEAWKWDIRQYRGYDDELVKNCATSLYDSEKLMNKLYVQNLDDIANPLVSPLYMKDYSILPDMLIMYAEYDYLRLQIEAFINKLKDKVQPICFQGLNHAFLDLIGIVDQSELSLQYASQFIRKKVEENEF